MITRFLVALGDRTFTALVEARAPATVAWLAHRLPLEGLVTHARWSGEAGWVRLAEQPDMPFENSTAYPAPGQLLLYRGDLSEPEILLPYGPCAFASRSGLLAGNHFATIRDDLDAWRAAGEALVVTGAKTFRLSAEE
ncbi:MAG TPA: DUF3830 family protein [Caulobacteraceae bacterium]|jgi:hypothetical protein